MREKKKQQQREYDWSALSEQYAVPYRHDSASKKAVSYSLIEALTGILSGKKPEEALLSHVITHIISRVQSAGNTTVETQDSQALFEKLRDDEQCLTEHLFSAIRQEAQPFLMISQENDKIVYGDPDDPHNPDKQITYRWNQESESWNIAPGARANAMIPDVESRQFITVNNGKAISYGTGKNFNIREQLSEDYAAKDDLLRKEDKNRMAAILGHNDLFAFAVSQGKQGDLAHYAEELKKTECGRGRAILLGDIISTLNDKEYHNVLDALPYQDEQGNRYLWKDIGEDGPLCLKYKADGAIDILLADKPLTSEHVVLLGQKEVNSDGVFTKGGQIVYIQNDGQVASVTNSECTNPKLSCNVIRISEQEMTQHLEKAKEAAQTFLVGKTLTPELVKENKSTFSQRETIRSDAKKKSNLQNLYDKTNTGLPQNIKVTSLDDTPTFEMHCPPFRESNCLDEAFDPYEATVYVLKKTGSDIDKDKSHALMLEVRDNGEIRLRSGTCGDKAVQAKITVQHGGKAYTAILDEKDGEPLQTYDKEATDMPFREAGMPSFMCVRGCCSHYSEANKRLIENPALAKQQTI